MSAPGRPGGEYRNEQHDGTPVGAVFSLDGDASPHGLRQAALLLHGVAAADRAWMLQQLDDGPRQALEALLAELLVLGVPASAELVQEALQTTPSAEAVSSGTAPASASTRPLNLPSPDALHAMLNDEPDALVARVLASTEPRVRAVVMSKFALPRRRHLSDLIATTGERGGASSGAHLDRALRSALDARVAAAQRSNRRWGALRWRAASAKILSTAQRWRSLAAAPLTPRAAP